MEFAYILAIIRAMILPLENFLKDSLGEDCDCGSFRRHWRLA